MLKDFCDINIPREDEHAIYELTIALRHRDKRIKCEPVSKYMESYVRAAKGVYLAASHVCDLSEIENSPMQWVDIITKSEKMGHAHPSLFSLVHYRDFLREVESWLVQHRLDIGELRYRLSKGMVSQWFFRRRIKHLKGIVKAANEDLAKIRQAYSLEYTKENTVYGKEK